MEIFYERESGELLLDCTNKRAFTVQAPCCSQMCSHVIYRCRYRTAGQHRGIFQESLVLVFLENMLFSEMDLMLVFMNQ